MLYIVDIKILNNIVTDFKYTYLTFNKIPINYLFEWKLLDNADHHFITNHLTKL